MDPRLRRWLRLIIDREGLDRELDEELSSYLALVEDEAAARGESRAEARRKARLMLGGKQQVKQRVREERMGVWLETLARDTRIAARTLMRAPLVTAVAMVTLGLAIGANTAIFSAVDAVLLEPLDFRAPDRLVRLYSSFPQKSIPLGTSSLLDVGDWEEQSSSFESMAVYPNLSLGGLVHTGSGSPTELETIYVSRNFFSTLGVEAKLGRTFTPEEHVEGSDRVVVLAHGTWLNQFAARETIVGERLTLSGTPYTVVGVMPPGFDFPVREAALWAPLSLIPPSSVPRERYVRWLNVVARLRPGVPLEAAETELSGIAARLSEAYPEANEGLTRVTARPLRDAMVSDSRTALLVLFGSVGVVLLIGCANIASLLLAQAEKRARELALRSALGAGRARLVRQALVESGLLGLAGAGLGVALAYATLPLLQSTGASTMPLIMRASIDARVLVFTLTLGVLASLLVGTLPAVRASRKGQRLAIADGARGSLGERRSHARGALVIAQVALVVVLATGAGLLARSYERLLAVEPGIETSGLLTMSVPIQLHEYPETTDMVGFLDRARESVSGVPGVESVSFVRPLPLRFDTFAGESFAFDIEGRPDRAPSERPRAALRFAGPGYFRTMGIPLLAGRAFDERDGPDSPFVLVANRRAAETYWPNEDPLAARISVGGPFVDIVGVVDDVRQTGLDEEPAPAFYTTYRQTTRVGVTLVARVDPALGSPYAVAGPVREAIWRVNADQPIQNVATMEEVLAASLAGPRLSTALLSGFALVALLLSSIGLYGVVAYGVTRRSRELGLRMALGATSRAVVGAVAREGLTLLGIGLALGLLVAWMSTRFMASLLFEVGARDPWTFTVISAVLLAIGLAASILPARDATRVDPVRTLRAP